MIVQSKRVWVGGQFLPYQLVLEHGKIEQILPYGARPADEDYGNARIVPGFIDVHTHGAYGYDTNDAQPDGLRHWLRSIPEEGVTALLPTTVTQLPEVLEPAVRSVAQVVREGYEGAEILGIHFEGPYLNMEREGAQPPEAIVPASVGQFQRYQQAADGLIRYITLAPEEDKDLALTRYCSSHGVVVSMGHSSADYDRVMEAVANGARSMTHVHNGMPPYHHREPGLVGAALRLHGVFGEIIGDGCHTHVTVLNNFFSAKGRDDAILITDSLRVKYCPPGGEYELGGHPIEVGADGLARLKGTDTIAGSTLRMNQGLRILVERAMVPFDAALNACTINPARCLRIDGRKGRLCAGYDADLVVLDEDYGVQQTYCCGKPML